ncbi:HAD-IIB family hydrolase [Spiroplasma apis]|uniref:HAD superfamily hydrolase n=1 Tax=Spiroplasma apis B31 TaxID=1276258 RepID=V5RHM2_SPIAP|nr:HAD-IIB family hydrolase [Spiroplasma apis]AHB35963.1 HAD superfamily hydrolase [Spiroplasma apis B31]
MRNEFKEKLLIFSDLDGTALNSNHEFSERTKNTVRKAYENGHYFIPITARSTKDGIFTQAINIGIDKLGGIAVSNNGTHIYDFESGTWLREIYVSQKLIKKIFNKTFGKVGKYKVHYFANDITYVYGPGENSRYWSDIMKVDYKVIESLEEITKPISHLTIILPDNAGEVEEKELHKDFNFAKRGLDIIKYTNRVYEIIPKNINKGEAAQFISKHFAKKNKSFQSICFGDNFNDIPLFEKTDYSVAMDNAIDTLKKIATHKTLSNNEDGVAHFIEKEIL